MKKLRILLMPVIGIIELFSLILCAAMCAIWPKLGDAMVEFCIGIFPGTDWYSGHN